MSTPLLVFRYHPDPRATGAFTESSQSCACCGQARGMQYTGSVYSVEEVGVLCPWCLADGSARRFDAEFTAADDAPSDVPGEVLDELLQRTPGFTA